jgi:hypothetical protein
MKMEVRFNLVDGTGVDWVDMSYIPDKGDTVVIEKVEYVVLSRRFSIIEKVVEVTVYKLELKPVPDATGNTES